MTQSFRSSGGAERRHGTVFREVLTLQTGCDVRRGSTQRDEEA